MKIEIVGRDYAIDDKLKALLLKKLKRLDKYFGDETPARLVLSQQSNEYKMEITVFSEKPVRAEAFSVNINDNIDLLIPRVTRQFRKVHTRAISSRTHDE